MMVHWKRFDFDSVSNVSVFKGKKLYDDNIFTLDVETSSIFYANNIYHSFNYDLTPEYYRNAEKFGILYIWQFSINDIVLYGRTLQELLEFIIKLHERIPATKIIYIHNLAFEFQFLRNILPEMTAFARKRRHPLKATCSEFNLEFRCSLSLTGMALKKLPKALGLDVEKQVGLLDYDKLRLPVTPLTDDEMKYCEYDCIVLYKAIQKHKAQYKNVFNIPLTQTGKVRRVIKAIYKKNRSYYRKLVSMLPTTFREFKVLCTAYSGGYTHANAMYCDDEINNVHSMDIASSYPAVMIAEKFPMTKFIPTKKVRRFEDMDKDKAYILDVTFTNLCGIISYNYLSKSKAVSCNKVVEDNGRIAVAKEIRYILTDVDISIIQKTYKYEYVINAAHVARKEYLDKNFVEYIIELYNGKTSLKDIPDKDDLYKQHKEFINALYGMCVTNTIRDEVVFKDNSWSIDVLDAVHIEEKLIEQTKKNKAFVNYSWGVYITAYARANLWNIIIQISDDVVYTDTDSVKYINAPKNNKYFEDYNNRMLDKLTLAMNHHEIPLNKVQPKDINGVIHTIGLYEYEGCYNVFKTLGAKKYCYEKGGKLHITVSGVNKETGAKAMHSISDFTEHLIFDYNNSGRLIMTYCDNQPEITVTDYMGNTQTISQQFGINGMKTTYHLGISELYKDYKINYAGYQSTHATLITGGNEYETEIL